MQVLLNTKFFSEFVMNSHLKVTDLGEWQMLPHFIPSASEAAPKLVFSWLVLSSAAEGVPIPSPFLL